MTQKCIDNELFEDTNHSHHNAYDDAAFLSFDEPAAQTDFEKLGQWILQAQDGVVHKSDFRKLEHWLVTDTRALEYYVEFMWICASLHALHSEKQMVLT